jgi:dipeptidyl aminopeptidase/acylaminoacyl peptidase
MASPSPAFAQSASPAPRRIEVPSSADGTLQPALLYLPVSAASSSAPMPLVVKLHTWSFDLEQRDTTVESEANARGWLLLAPNFRGKNDNPAACGSALAQQDVLDAVAWVRGHYPVDARRIYLLGRSGGGYLTMLMAARHPAPWAAASAWVGISDMRTWYDEHAGDDYGRMMRACYGGAPGAGDSLAALYRARSPLAYLAPTGPVPLDLAAGRSDSVVAFTHTLRAFQALAPGVVSEAEFAALVRPGPGLGAPAPGDTASDVLFGRRIFLRRAAGASRVTIFDGGHEWLASAAMAWLSLHHKP